MDQIGVSQEKKKLSLIFLIVLAVVCLLCVLTFFFVLGRKSTPNTSIATQDETIENEYEDVSLEELVDKKIQLSEEEQNIKEQVVDDVLSGTRVELSEEDQVQKASILERLKND